MELLYVDACPRGDASRTKALAEALLKALLREHPGLTVNRHVLAEMGLRDMNARRLTEKESLCDRAAWADPMLRAGAEFRRADAVLIAAPYWDLSFPSVLKTWVENIWVRGLTFVYREDRPVGLARGKAAVYVTTAGSHMAGHDWGTLYMEDVLKTLGIRDFRAVRAEALDLDSSDPDAILAEAARDADDAGRWLARQLKEV